MGSPTIFAGRRTKLLTADGVLTKEGRTIDYDGAINYIGNCNAEINANGWTLYADAAGTAPVDGTGGTATNIAWTRNTVTPIRGNGDFLFSKTGTANCQGMGVSYEFIHPGMVEGNTISFEYQVVSGTFTDDYIRIYIVDVTTGAVIEPVNVKLANVGVISKHIATFQTTLASTAYRLCIHVADATTNNFDLQFDNFEVGPKPTAIGAYISDYTEWTPTGSWTTNTVYLGDWRRVGDTFEARISVATTGAPTSTPLRVNLPAGLTIKLPNAVTDFTVVGTAGINDSSTSAYKAYITYYSSTAVSVRYQSATSGLSSQVTQNTPITFGNGDSVNLSFSIPIVGWGSNVSFSSADSGRVVAAKMYRDAAANLAPNNTSVKVSLDATEFDTHGGANTASGRYDIKESGYYDIWGQVSVNAANVAASAYFSRIYLNGNAVKSGVSNYQSSAAQGMRLGVQAKLWCNAGDYIELYFFGQANNSTSQLSVAAGALTTTLEIHKISAGSMAITAGETVHCLYTSATTTIGTTATTIVMPTKVTDTHAAYNNSTGIFTAPVAGVYRFSGSCQSSSAVAGGANTSTTLNVIVNSVSYRIGLFLYQTAVTITPNFPGGSVDVYMLAGQSANLSADRSASVSSYALNSSFGYFSVTKVG